MLLGLYHQTSYIFSIGTHNAKTLHSYHGHINISTNTMHKWYLQHMYNTESNLETICWGLCCDPVMNTWNYKCPTQDQLHQTLVSDRNKFSLCGTLPSTHKFNQPLHVHTLHKEQTPWTQLLGFANQKKKQRQLEGNLSLCLFGEIIRLLLQSE